MKNGLVLLLLWSSGILGPGLAHAQSTGPRASGQEAFVNSEVEKYERALQLAGVIAPYPWSIRSFEPSELTCCATTEHPWSARYDFEDRDWSFRWVRPSAAVRFNSAFPYGRNDGVVWEGKGLTTSLQAGFSVRKGPLWISLAPVIFRAQNAEFGTVEPSLAGSNRYADPDFPTTIDLPQRFGTKAYTRLDPGESPRTPYAAFLSLGASTASQHWGPAREHPLILGNNAGGFPHLFVGTSRPLDLWLARLHTRVTWGLLSQSDYSAAEGAARRRFMSGFVALLIPRGVPGLELGAGRFFHTPWPEDGLTGDNFLKPFEGILKKGLDEGEPGAPGTGADNQLASIFARWTFPRSGLEVYGEFAREDHNWDLRDALVEPDHDSGYSLGLAKLWQMEPDRWVQVRGEILNTRMSHLEIVRHQTRLYRHSQTVQGHTQRGQLLGSVAGYGGGGSVLAADLYHKGGRWSVALSRSLRRQASVDDEWRTDGSYALELEGLFFKGPIEWTVGLSNVYEIDRDFNDDAYNLNASIEMNWTP